MNTHYHARQEIQLDGEDNMELIPLLTIMILVGTTMVSGTILLRVALNQHCSDQQENVASVTVIGLACVSFAVLAGIHFYEPLIKAIAVYL